MKFTHVSQLVNFMYRGEINITQVSVIASHQCLKYLVRNKNRFIWFKNTCIEERVFCASIWEHSHFRHSYHLFTAKIMKVFISLTWHWDNKILAVNVFLPLQDMLSGLLKTAETLKVKGLAEVSGDQPAAQTTNPIPPILRLGVSVLACLYWCFQS